MIEEIATCAVAPSAPSHSRTPQGVGIPQADPVLGAAPEARAPITVILNWKPAP